MKTKETTLPRPMRRAAATPAALALGVIALSTGCSPSDPLPAGAAPLDYRQDRYWAALGLPQRRPLRQDLAGRPEQQTSAVVDVLYLHPTTLGLNSDAVANGDVDDADQRAHIDATLATQMAAFTGSTRIFAP